MSRADSKDMVDEMSDSEEKIIKTTKRWIFFSVFLTMLGYTIITPFFPPLAKKIGISEIMIAVVIAVHPLASFITSSFVKNFMGKFGRTNLIVVGLILTGLAQGGFGIIGFITDPTLAIIVGLITRILEGIASSFVRNSAMSILSINEPKKASHHFASLQISIGAAVIIGPVIGQILYNELGFFLPLQIANVLSVMSGIVCFFEVVCLADRKAETKDSDLEDALLPKSDNTKENETPDISTRVLLKNTDIRIFVSLLSVSFANMTLFLVLVPLRVGEAFPDRVPMIGAFQSVRAMGYIGGNALAKKFLDGNRHGTIFWTLTGGVITSVIYGPLYLRGIIELPVLEVFFWIGSFCGTFFMSLMRVNLSSLVLESAKLTFGSVPKVSDLHSSLINMIASATNCLCPIIGASIFQAFGWRTLCTSYAFLLLGLVLVFLLRHSQKIFQSPSSHETEEKQMIELAKKDEQIPD